MHIEDVLEENLINGLFEGGLFFKNHLRSHFGIELGKEVNSLVASKPKIALIIKKKNKYHGKQKKNVKEVLFSHSKILR